MLLDLRGIIELPGGKVSFDYAPDLSGIITGSIVGVKEPTRAVGSATNRAGLLTLNCTVDAVFICSCARCLKEFEYSIHKTVTANITQSGIGEDADGYFLQNDAIDATEIIVTELILNLDDKLLCRDDCAGLCQKCGADLNNGACGCKKDIDPRLAVLKEFTIEED